MKQKNPFLLVSRLCLLTAVPTRWTLNVLQATPRSRYRQEVQHPATSRGLCATPDVHVLEARGGARPGIKVPWTGKCSSGHTGLAEFLCEDKTPSTPETWRQKSSDKVSVCLSVYVHSRPSCPASSLHRIFSCSWSLLWHWWRGASYFVKQDLPFVNPF